MSVVNSIFAQGERALVAGGHGDELTVLSGVDINKTFTARLDVEAPSHEQFLLGQDPRMRSIARFLPPEVPRLKGGDILTDGFTRWRVIELLDSNASSITTDFEIQQIAPIDT